MLTSLLDLCNKISNHVKAFSCLWCTFIGLTLWLFPKRKLYFYNGPKSVISINEICLTNPKPLWLEYGSIYRFVHGLWHYQLSSLDQTYLFNNLSWLNCKNWAIKMEMVKLQSLSMKCVWVKLQARKLPVLFGANGADLAILDSFRKSHFVPGRGNSETIQLL